MDYSTEVTFAYNVKLFILSIGVLFFFAAIYFYHRSIFKSESDIKASFGSWKILLKRATPGTLLIVASTIIIAIGATKKMGSTSSTKYQIDSNELRNTIETLKVDSSLEVEIKKVPNLDSMIKTANLQVAKKRYLNSLKTLYLAKGIVFSDTSKKSYLMKINQEIELVEAILNEQLISLPKQNSTEQTRATNINSTGHDSIR